jgi:hypothetical protein
MGERGDGRMDKAGGRLINMHKGKFKAVPVIVLT